MPNYLGYSICDPCGHPWICCVPKTFIYSEIKRLKQKIKREGIKVRKTTKHDMEKVEIWTFENYLKRIEKKKQKVCFN